ncbi:uncharacterized protein [Musca autumnalis]|uniref:uncharacterized protein n=1 Tax=Musca autumnalis TaxID=221902 RepID=UPI003CF6D924
MDEKKRVVRILLDPNATESTFYKSSLYVPFDIEEDEGLVEVQLTDRHSEVRTLTVKLNIKAGAPPEQTPRGPSALKKLQRDFNNAISILKLYKIDIGSWDPIFVFQCSLKLPKLTLSLWEQSIAKKTEMPSWEELNTFLTERFHALESVSDIYGPQSSRSSLPQQQKFNNFERTKNYKVHHTKVSSQKCNLCKGNHILRSCPKFLSMDFTNRMSIVKRDNHSLNCLAQGHMVANCSSKNRCSKCNSNHHTLLHKPNMSQQGNNKSKESRQMSQSSQTTSLQSTDMPSTSENIRTYHTSVASKTMLATAWVTIVKNGMSHRVRALIDPCSDDSFVSERIQKLLKLPTMPIAANISGLGGECLARCNKVAVFTISSLIDPTFSIDIDALVVPDVTGNVPTHSFDQFNRKRLPKLKFADPDFYKSAPVDILIGGNLYPVILLGGVEHGILGSLVAQETVFGWIVTGPTNSRVPRTTTRVSHCTRVSIDKQLARFWEIEEIPTKPKVSEDDKICEQIYADTVKRNTDGRYMVDLPFKIDEPSKSVLNSNRYVALCQFLRNEQSMSKKPELKSMYDEVIQEYLSLGHMELVEPPTSNYEQCFYLPHHGVYKPESATTKLRVVFNGSCATATGKSLNDKLYVGPVLQKDIISLILNWRLYKYVFNADISKMYRQILVNPNQTTFQRFVYRTSPDEEIKDYKLNTVTFGLNCAPYLALRTLQQLAQDEEQRFPIGAKILKENMYVDDALVGIHTIPEGKVAKEQLTNILKSAGFHLRKWTSNCKELLDDLPRDHLFNEEFLNFDDNTIHLEAVSDLSTPAFMAALTRFVSRRGCPNKIFSDNGRNFVGAAREIKANFRKVILDLKEKAISHFGQQKLEWHFIPASAPHMGGLWEAGVKSCKTHLKKISGQIRHTYEEFTTILATIEACLNSRPLTPQSDNIDDLTALTPAHFLIGSSLLAPAEPEAVPTKTALLNRWLKLKVISQEFCRRW